MNDYEIGLMQMLMPLFLIVKLDHYLSQNQRQNKKRLNQNQTFIIDSGGKLSTRLYDKCDDFDFHIVNFPYLSSNIPSDPSYGVYISQLIRYAQCCSHYDDFRYRHKCLVDRLLSKAISNDPPCRILFFFAAAEMEIQLISIYYLQSWNQLYLECQMLC